MKTLYFSLLGLLAACGHPQNSAQVYFATPDSSVVIDAFPDTQTASVAGMSSLCPDGMIHIEGDFCPIVEQPCLEWANDYADPHQQELRCLRFGPSTCESSHRVHMSYCMDQYEWPNTPGLFPTVMITYLQAERACTGLHLRLCTSNEWTFACEGPEMFPYPYGYERNNQTCNIDNPNTVNPNRRLLGSSNEQIALAEAQRVYRAERSGTRESCVSWSGVHDLTGNVDEWNTNPNGFRNHRPYYSNLKGGDWRFVRTRCRPSTTSHGPSFRYYNIGWRCCSDMR
jgi:sulfatase modifying factor 1